MFTGADTIHEALTRQPEPPDAAGQKGSKPTKPNLPTDNAKENSTYLAFKVGWKNICIG